MRTPPGHLYAAKCACCHAEAIMECVECLRSGQDEAGPSFCSAACLKKHFGQHRQKRSSSSSGSSISSGSSSPSLSGSEPSSPQSPSPSLLPSRGTQWQSPAHHYLQQYVHVQPPPPRGYAPIMHGHRHAMEMPIAVGGPAAPHWQHSRRR